MKQLGSRLAKLGLAAALAVSASLGGPVRPTAAYCTLYISKWYAATQTLTTLPNEIPAGWNAQVSAAVVQWNNIEPALFYHSPIFYTNNLGDFNLWRADFSNNGWMDFPSVTFNTSNNSPHVASNVYTNTDFSWNTTGVMNQNARNADVRTVTIHEFGHSSGLNHPQLCGQLSQNEIDSAMYANWTKKWTTNIDDDWGIQSIYP
jgi:hypothetical protein